MPEDQTGLRAPLSLRDYLRILWRRSWIVVAVAGIVFGVGLYRSNSQTRVYQAQGQVQLPGTSTANGAGSTSDIDTQVGIIASPVVHGTAARTAPGIGQVTAQQAGLGNIIAVTATSAVPAQAARTVNATMDAYAAYVRRQGEREATASAAVAQSGVNSLQTQINALNAQPIAPGTAAAARRDALVTGLITRQTALQQQLDGFRLDFANAGAGINVVARPTVPTSPIRPNVRTDGLLALGAGLVLGLVLALFVEYLVRSDSEAKRVDKKDDAAPRPVVAAGPAWAPLPAPAPKPDEFVRRGTGDVSLMGVIPTAQTSAAEVVSLSAPESSAAQSYRSLRSAASFIGLERGRCFEITSVPDREGKTETVANLAVLLAGAGQRVVVVDCDLSRPRVHEFFGLTNEIGLTSVMNGAPLERAVMCVPAFEHLYVLTSGPPSADSEAALRSDRCREIFDSLLVGGTLVLVEAPPMLSGPDALTIAQTASVDGILLVASVQADARNLLRQALDALHRSGDQPIGVVLTDAPDAASEPQAVRTVRRTRRRQKAQDANDAANPPEVLIAELVHDDVNGANGSDATRRLYQSEAAGSS